MIGDYVIVRTRNAGVLCEKKGIISGTTEYKFIVEDYEVTKCSIEAENSLRRFKANETTY